MVYLMLLRILLSNHLEFLLFPINFHHYQIFSLIYHYYIILFLLIVFPILDLHNNIHQQLLFFHILKNIVVHGARVDVQIRVDLDERDVVAHGLKEKPCRGRDSALTYARQDSPRNYDVLNQRKSQLKFALLLI
jgi:hypothetical protein